MNTPNANTAYRLCAALLSVLCIQDVSARCGSVDYSWGADGLAEATAFVGTMMIYIVEILYAFRWHPLYDRCFNCHASVVWLSRHEFRILDYLIANKIELSQIVELKN